MRGMAITDREKPMAGKTCMVTGATSGIGEAAALSLALQGAVVILVGRNQKKCHTTAEKIKRAARSSTVEFAVADLSVQSDIHRLAEQFRANQQRLDVLVNNAGARFSSPLSTPEGFEMSFALNHLAYFVLTNLLLQALKRSSAGRIVNVASGAHTGCRGINFDDVHSRNNYIGKEAYAQSKLANIMFTYELARRLEGTGITVNAVEPGNVLSNFSRNNGWVSWARHIAGSLQRGKILSPTEGAKTVVYLASSPEVEGISGKYFSEKKEVRSSDASYDVDAAKRLWNLSQDMTMR